jgi:hypothetical protein
MSQQCPRCRLFNPAEAARCDCGYDFATKSVKGSYLLEHVVEKQGGEARVVAAASRANLRSGISLLVLAAIFSAGAYYSGQPRLFLVPVIWGIVLLARGLRQRRHGRLDAATRKSLIRRS